MHRVQGKDTCWPVHSPIKYFIQSYGQITERGEEGELVMMNEIFQRGPITCRWVGGLGGRSVPGMAHDACWHWCAPLTLYLSLLRCLTACPYNHCPPTQASRLVGCPHATWQQCSNAAVQRPQNVNVAHSNTQQSMAKSERAHCTSLRGTSATMVI
jgi:hypothetical protein